MTKDDPLQHIHDLNSNQRGKRFFSKIDLVHGFHLIQVKERDIPKTAIRIPFGLYKYLKMLFELNIKCFFVVLDDILNTSSSPNDNEEESLWFSN